MGKHFTAAQKAKLEELQQEGYTFRQIGDIMGYSRMRIKEYFRHLRKKEQVENQLDPSKRKGRPRKNPLSPERKYELRIKELECELELLRSFLLAAGRR